MQSSWPKDQTLERFGASSWLEESWNRHTHMGSISLFIILSIPIGISPPMDLLPIGFLLCNVSLSPDFYAVLCLCNARFSGMLLLCVLMIFFTRRHQSKLTNLGKIMELHGPRLLGASYKDPISSFSLFQKFSSQNPEVWIQFCAGIYPYGFVE